METSTVPLSDLRYPEQNVRSHPEKQVQEMARALEQFGQIRPAVVDENYTVLIGNGMVMAMVRLDWSEAEVYVYRGLTEAQKRKLMLSDNRMSSLGATDFDAQLEVLEQILRESADYDIPGFEMDMLEAMVDGEAPEGSEAGQNASQGGHEPFGEPSASSAPGEPSGNDTASGEPQSVASSSSTGGGGEPPGGGSDDGGPYGRRIQCPNCYGMIEMEE